MESKKATATAAGLPRLRSAAACVDRRPGPGRIVWANGVSVKIAWDGGEQVTWRRDSLAGRPIEILADDEDQPRRRRLPKRPKRPETARGPGNGPGTARGGRLAFRADHGGDAARGRGSGPRAGAADPRRGRHGPPTRPSGRTNANGRQAETRPEGRGGAAAEEARRPGRRRPGSGGDGAPMGCKELIGAMAGKGYWMSPGGKTPSATLL